MFWLFAYWTEWFIKHVSEWWWLVCSDAYTLQVKAFPVYYFFLSAHPSPVPEIHWKKIGGSLPLGHEVRMAGAQLHLFNVQFEDEGTYRCEAVNSRGKDYHTARVSVEGKKYVTMNTQWKISQSHYQLYSFSLRHSVWDKFNSPLFLSVPSTLSQVLLFLGLTPT